VSFVFTSLKARGSLTTIANTKYYNVTASLLARVISLPRRLERDIEPPRTRYEVPHGRSGESRCGAVECESLRNRFRVDFGVEVFERRRQSLQIPFVVGGRDVGIGSQPREAVQPRRKPITHAAARDYWISLIGELEAGSRILLVASGDDIVVGSGQLELSQRPNSPHRAELQKLFVDRASRGQGIGRLLVRALHDAAREKGRTLIRLSTRHGEPAEEFYKSLGYKEVE